MNSIANAPVIPTSCSQLRPASPRLAHLVAQPLLAVLPRRARIAVCQSFYGRRNRAFACVLRVLASDNPWSRPSNIFFAPTLLPQRVPIHRSFCFRPVAKPSPAPAKIPSKIAPQKRVCLFSVAYKLLFPQLNSPQRVANCPGVASQFRVIVSQSFAISRIFRHMRNVHPQPAHFQIDAEPVLASLAFCYCSTQGGRG